VLASLAFCLLHVTAMVGLRHLAYAWQGAHYDFGFWPRELLYEYLKDWRTYAGILLIVLSYRLLVLRLQGEARLLDAPDDEAPPVEPVERPERFLVRKLGKEFLVAANDIELLQASGNYVNLRVRGHDYPLRATMAGIEPRMDPARFARVHRSFMVNLDCIAVIEPLDTGDARLVMRDGTRVPCSRRYRAALKP
jgi:DNA-binding LytR/AlgR family response regulator